MLIEKTKNEKCVFSIIFKDMCMFLFTEEIKRLKNYRSIPFKLCRENSPVVPTLSFFTLSGHCTECKLSKRPISQRGQDSDKVMMDGVR